MVILAGKIRTEGSSAFGTLLLNPTLLEMDWDKTGNTIIGTSSIGLFNSDLPPRWYTADSMGVRYAVSQISRNQISIQAYNNDGSAYTGDLSSVEFQVEL